MPEMGVGDIQQKFEDSLLMRNNKPYVFLKYNEAECRVFDIMEQKEEVFRFDEKDWVAPVPRIGMINIGGSVVYASRIPVRRYKLGLSTENLQAELVKECPFPNGRGDVYSREVKGLRSKALGDALLRKYPTLKQALIRVGQFEGAVAFDKQFAVNHLMKLIYKKQVVGTHDGCSIRFDEKWQHLSILV